MNDPIMAWAVVAFVGLAALSMVVQAIATMKIKTMVGQLQRDLAPLLPQAEATIESARLAINDSRNQINEISVRSIAVLESAQLQLSRVEEVVLDAAARAKHQLERTEMVVEDTVTRVHETVAAVQGTILKPIREVNGLAAGIRAGVLHLMKGNRPNVAHATQDEEMFI
ncbi:MAG: hypothetical protein NTZ56_21465 [Acidobacteria bacterium]|nr:hypothetical protein [Acidobacteriota bacterium]